MSLQIKSGYGAKTLPLWAVFNLYIIFICTSIPGLAISPIMGKLTEIFPGTSALETQMLEVGPNLAAIPFVFLGGWIGTKFNNSKLTTWTCLFFAICGVAFFFVKSMLMLIVLSFLIGIAAGILSPLSSAFIADMFNGNKRTAQYGYTSATLNLVLMGCVIATGYLAKINWRLPFMIYLLPFVPLFFAKGFAKYITNPSEIRKSDAAKINAPTVKYKFSEQVNVPMLVRYCAYYFFITLVIAAISLYIPFLFTNSSVAGDLTSVLFFGIMISGYTLNWILKILKNKVAIIVIIAVFLGFLLIVLKPTSAWLVGIGILVSTYFYGVAQPYYYNKLSVASSRIALTLTLAWFASMDSIGNVVAPFVIDGIAKIFHESTQSHPVVAFQICMWMSLIAAGIVIIRKIIVSIRDKEKEDKLEKVEAINPAAKNAVEKEAETKKAVASDPGVSADPIAVNHTPKEEIAKAINDDIKATVDDVKAGKLAEAARTIEKDAENIEMQAKELDNIASQLKQDATNSNKPNISDNLTPTGDNKK